MNNLAMYWKLACGIAFLCLAVQAELPDLNNLNDINVDDLQNQLASKNITIDNAKTLVRDKCIKLAGEDKGNQIYSDIEAGTSNLSQCLMGLVNYTIVQQEIDVASPKGELDVVFNKYCAKKPMAIDCLETFNDKLKPCLDEEEQSHQKVFMNIANSLLNFVCHKGGDQIALFIAEKGPECLESKKSQIQECINSTFSGYLPKDDLGSLNIDSVKSLPKFVMGNKQCVEMQELEKCVVAHLEHCDEITPANIVESLFRFIKKETTCHNSTALAAKQSSGKGSGNRMQTSWLLIPLMLVVALTTSIKWL